MRLLKEKDNYYLVNDEKKIKLEIEVVQKFKLYYEDENLLVKEIISENNYYFYYKLALKRLSKMQSQKMLENYLETKGIDQITLKKVIKRLTELKYLDDYEYAKNYINLKMYSFGPLKLENKLIEDGVNYRIVKELVSEIDEAEILQSLLEKDLLKISSSIYNHKQKLTRKYYMKGFNLSLINELLSNLLDEVSYDEFDNLKKDYQKLLLRSKSLNKSDYEIKIEIRHKLLHKGYRLENIKKVEEGY